MLVDKFDTPAILVGKRYLGRLYQFICEPTEIFLATQERLGNYANKEHNNVQLIIDNYTRLSKGKSSLMSEIRECLKEHYFPMSNNT
jgi:hypothetical protein